MSDCIFCKIIKGELPSAKVYEDDKTVAFLDIKPVNPGHVMVIPKEHHETILDTPEDVLAAIMLAVKKIAPAVLKAVGSEGFNLGVNNGAVAGQLVPHLHFHIMPRLPGDGHGLWDGRAYANGEMQNVAAKIRSNII